MNGSRLITASIDRYSRAKFGLHELIEKLRLITSDQLQFAEVDTEPLYTPDPPTLHFMRGSIPSLLHEFAHWCIAGEKRRKLQDYGYWYEPANRHLSDQSRFQEAEVYPQAVECLLSVSVGREFVASFDNFSISPQQRYDFAVAVGTKLQDLARRDISPRIDQLIRALARQCATESKFEDFLQICRQEIFIPPH